MIMAMTVREPWVRPFISMNPYQSSARRDCHCSSFHKRGHSGGSERERHLLEVAGCVGAGAAAQAWRTWVPVLCVLGAHTSFHSVPQRVSRCLVKRSRNTYGMLITLHATI